MSDAYSAIVRSLENLPEQPTFSYGLTCPTVGVLIKRSNCRLRLSISGQVGQVHVVVAVRQKHIADWAEDAGFITVEVIGKDQIECARVSGSFS